MAWLCAEYIADEMLRSSALVQSGSLEFRAGRQTLALTIHLCETRDGFGAEHTAARIEEWLGLTAYGHPWQEWVQQELTTRAVGSGADPDLDLAVDAWRWLRETELLAADLGDQEPWQAAHRPLERGVDEAVQVWTPAWQLGLPLGHLAVHLY
jgi:hypothetical protein